jgi:hypothetical protein
MVIGTGTPRRQQGRAGRRSRRPPFAPAGVWWAIAFDAGTMTAKYK